MSRDPFPFLAQFLFDGLSQTSFRSSHLFFIFQPREEETQLSHASVNPLVRYVDFCLSLSLTEFPACTPLSLSLSLSLSLYLPPSFCMLSQRGYTRREFYGNFYHTLCGNLVFYEHSGDFCHTFLCYYYAYDNMRHTEDGNNSHTMEFHTVL